MPNDCAAVPEFLPGEPPSRVPTAPRLALLLVARSLAALVAMIACAPLWPAYLLGNLAWGRPPHLPSAARARRCLALILRGPLPRSQRAGLSLEVARRVALHPFWGLAWHLDTLLVGAVIDGTPIDAPLFEISAARSGSTQLARHLEADPRLAAPSALMCAYPYLWLWRLVARVAPAGAGEAVRQRVRKALPPEFVERHELDPLRMDTFEMVYLLFNQWGDIFLSLGPDALRDELSFGKVRPVNAGLWTGDFLRYLDAVGRKTLLYRGPNRRLFLKGHFLHVAPLLEQSYPGARFLAVLREPSRRMQSVVNFWRCHPSVAPSPHVPWPWVARLVEAADPEYNEAEIEFFSRSGPSRRCLVDFADYVQDLPATLAQVYRECLDSEPPSGAPAPDAHRRVGYAVDRSLEAAGVNTVALAARHASYDAWRRATRARRTR